jgi:hypothetical protein
VQQPINGKRKSRQQVGLPFSYLSPLILINK